MLSRSWMRLTCLACILLVSSVSAVREIFICDHDAERPLPSILDSTAAMFGTGGEEMTKIYENLALQFDEVLSPWAKTPIPVANWFSDGVYSFSFYDNDVLKGSIIEVNLLQQDSKWSLTSAPFCLLQWDSWCTCATSTVSDLAKLHFENQSPCVTKLSKSVSEYLVDPSRPSCIQVLVSDDASIPSIDSLATFRVVVPTADTHILKVLVNRSLKDFPQIASAIIGCLNYIPLYLLSLAIGLYLTLNATEIAEEKLFQVTLQVVLGLFTALVVLLVVAHRILNNILSRHSSSAYMPRIVDSLFGFSVMSVAYQYRYFLMGQAFDMLIQFWDEGAFGYWWLGRAYFATCIVASLSICHFFDLFRDPDSRSFFVALLACRVLGWAFLLNSSSSNPIAWMITIVIMISFPLKSYFHYFYFVLAGYLQPTVGVANTMSRTNAGVFSPSSSSRKLTKAESDALVKSATAREMEKLRKFLKDNPQELAKFDQTMREDGKESTANLVGQFAANLYSGRPRPPTNVEGPSWVKRFIRMVRDVGVVLLFVGLLAAFTLKTDTVMNILREVL